ncbi:MAG: hypothetical protein Q8J96_11670 [Rhodocyclaceae bacterium]|nr:hypothetical protein [Rhodocyclaceae bacterium]
MIDLNKSRRWRDEMPRMGYGDDRASEDAVSSAEKPWSDPNCSVEKRKTVLRAFQFLAILEVVLIFGLLLITDAPKWLYVLTIVNGWVALVLGYFSFKSNY